MTQPFIRPCPATGLWAGRLLACRLLAAILLTAVLTMSTACERITPVRTLPSWVRGVYIPVFTNRSYEPQIEEYVTRYTQEAFLTDGRVSVVPKDQADVILKGEIVDWREESAGTSSDRIVDRADVTIVAEVKLYEPYNEQTPLADLGKITYRSTFNIDTRSINYDTEPDRKTQALRSLAEQIMLRTITGFPAQAGAPTTAGGQAPEYRSPESIPRRDLLEPHVIQPQR